MAASSSPSPCDDSRPRSCSSVVVYSEVSVSDTNDDAGRKPGTAASSAWKACRRARSGPRAMIPRSALWPRVAETRAWWPSPSSASTASSTRLAAPGSAAACSRSIV